MEKLDFQGLIQKREDWVRLSKENNFDFDSILAGLYNDPSHFVYEILQNAEDEGAKIVEFKLYDDRLDIFHDGEDFNAQDIDAITGIGISTKKDDVNTIGKFGVGFKSVFAITQTPKIHSGKYNFEIRDFVIPSLVDVDGNIKNTKITLSFNHKFRPQEQIFELVENKLKNLGLRSLLFLRNVDEIQWESPNRNGHYLKSTAIVEAIPGTKRVTIIAKTDDEETLQEYFVIEKIFGLDDKQLKVEVAFQIGKDVDSDKEIIIPVTDSRLIVYFPTEKVTFLNFLVQGPYKTTPNRENIPLDDEQNKFITEKIGELVAESISVIKQLGYLDINFLEVLPLKEGHTYREPIYSTIYEKVKAKFASNEQLLPTNNGRFTTTTNTLLARGKDLVEIFTQTDIEKLFSKKTWLDTSITYDRTRDLRDYLVNTLNVDEVDFEDFARKFTTEFFESKSDEWMADFYSRLNEQRALWTDRRKTYYPYTKGILRTKPIIRLEDNSHLAPFDQKDTIQVYLPSETKSKYHTVKENVSIHNESALEFLKALGLLKPDLFAEIREFVIPKYETDELDIEDEEYLEDFQKFLLAFGEEPSNQRREFLSNLQSLPVIKSTNVTGENKFLRPNKVYKDTDELRLYFEGYEPAYFVDGTLYSKFDTDLLDNFLMRLEVKVMPQKMSFNPYLSSEVKYNLRAKSGDSRFSDDRGATDYKIEGLEHFLEQPMTIERSNLLWQFLIRNIEKRNTTFAKQFFEGKYRWFYYSERIQNFDANFVLALRQAAWLIDQQGNFKLPSELTFSELSDEYEVDYSNIEVLKEKLGFKPDIFDQLPDDEKNILEITKGRSPEDLEKALALLDEQTKPEEQVEDTWEPDYEPDNVGVNIKEITLEDIDSPNLEDQVEVLDWNGNPNEIDEPDDPDPEPDPPDPPKPLKDIGKWGEQYVFKALKRRLGGGASIVETDYGCRVLNNQAELEIYWLNIKKDVGKGYDFVIKQDGEEIEYIEVKTTTEEVETLVRITGTQWEFARKLFNNGKGDKYFIYRVFSAGKSNAKIRKLKNPAKLWRDGKLYAHPVHFRL
ncbi:MAG: DUF3883 domain-containing protein [Deltaproteobacteria bacterium]|nr:DUF3883 domain-containing protein [Deltaproteobacteria bacterium]